MPAPTRLATLALLLALPLALAACGAEETPPAESPPAADGPAPNGGGTSAGGDHGDGVRLGEAEVAGRRLAAHLYGDVHPGLESALNVEVEGTRPAAVRAWIGVASARGSLKARLEEEGGALHGHLVAPDPLPEGSEVHIEVEEEDGSRERVGFALPEATGAVHVHADGPHDGVRTTFRAVEGDGRGHLELKLHDDKGDLELWLTADDAGTEPFDLPVDATITAIFPEDDRRIELSARDTERNEDEDGQPNVRDGKTNYFIFPGDSGADASWLVGADVRKEVRLQFTADGTRYTSPTFTVIPHTHGGHDHGGHDDHGDHEHGDEDHGDHGHDH